MAFPCPARGNGGDVWLFSSPEKDRLRENMGDVTGSWRVDCVANVAGDVGASFLGLLRKFRSCEKYEDFSSVL